jgi:hypothetical protein
VFESPASPASQYTVTVRACGGFCGGLRRITVTVTVTVTVIVTVTVAVTVTVTATVTVTMTLCNGRGVRVRRRLSGWASTSARCTRTCTDCAECPSSRLARRLALFTQAHVQYLAVSTLGYARFVVYVGNDAQMPQPCRQACRRWALSYMYISMNECMGYLISGARDSCIWYMYMQRNSPLGGGAHGLGPWRRWLTPLRSLPRCELSGSYTLNLAHGHGGHGEGVRT